MRWGRKPQREQQQQEEKKAFSLSHVLPFSWISKLKPTSSQPKPNSPHSNPSPGPKPTSNSNSKSISPPPPPRLAACSALPVPQSGDAPRRLSLGDDGVGLRQRRPDRRSPRHQSVGGYLELPDSQTLGHLIPFTRHSRASESRRRDGDLELARSRIRRRRRRTRPVEAADLDRTAECGGGEGRKSFSGKIRTRSKVRVYSPRMKAKAMAMALAMAKAEMEEEKGLERFAVVKCSRDPHKDFKESMVEMIWEKGIGRPEELESLLACYLTLNSDEYHDVIVKVFRQVWFEINPGRFGFGSNHQRG
ncbi:uncharacterized protein [Typha latifolia]|uniref:uncharacterized protein n=1 Tax=Typha latifolia TaxID=4733 RepID=UPI003C2BF784